VLQELTALPIAISHIRREEGGPFEKAGCGNPAYFSHVRAARKGGQNASPAPAGRGGGCQVYTVTILQARLHLLAAEQVSVSCLSLKSLYKVFWLPLAGGACLAASYATL
jgi:hypothetical protein